VTEAGWEQQVATAWSSFDRQTADEFLALIGRLAAEAPDRAAGLFERASAHDSLGHEREAVPLYREALALGLTGQRRRRAVIQLASSLRNIGQVQESVALLTAELGAGTDELDGAVRAFLALALADTGREREAVSQALTALAPHLPRYQRSLTNYARLLVSEADGVNGTPTGGR
jgi:tetratricopeptide (TPR) repeat protein